MAEAVRPGVYPGLVLVLLGHLAAGCSGYRPVPPYQEPETHQPAARALPRLPASSASEEAPSSEAAPSLSERRAQKIQEAENAVAYCLEVLQASGFSYTARKRYRKALDDLRRVRAGELDVTLERYGGFPVVDWISGGIDAEGVYRPGYPGHRRR